MEDLGWEEVRVRGICVSARRIDRWVVGREGVRISGIGIKSGVLRWGVGVLRWWIFAGICKGGV